MTSTLAQLSFSRLHKPNSNQRSFTIKGLKPEMLENMRRASREKSADLELEKTISAYERVLGRGSRKVNGKNGP
jgi:hypothetical protein